MAVNMKAFRDVQGLSLVYPCKSKETIADSESNYRQTRTGKTLCTGKPAGRLTISHIIPVHAS